MKVVPLIKTDKLFEYLDYEAQNALRNRGVLPLGGYAWKDEDTPSDQYIGLAMWELASPEASLYAGGASQPEDLRRKLIALETTGEDLRGLMEMARKSIGLALVYAEIAKTEAFNLHDPFWIHHLSSMNMLSMASERLKDLFLQGCTGQTAKEYKRGKTDDAKHYDHPFRNAHGLSWARQFQKELAELGDLATQIYSDGIDKRNGLVHELASELGRLAKDTAGSGSIFQRGRIETYAETKKAWDAALAKHEAEIEGAVQSLVKWYERLVKATSLVCEIEHAIRVVGAQTGAKNLP